MPGNGLYINPPRPGPPSGGTGTINAPPVGNHVFQQPTPPPVVQGGTGQGGPTPGSPMGWPTMGTSQNQVINSNQSSGFDPSYMQNLATSQGGLFQRPQGGLSFNPLGNLTDMAGTQMTGGGNAQIPGLPQTYLQAALAANPTFAYQQQPTGQARPQTPNLFSGMGGVSQLPNIGDAMRQTFGGGMSMFG